MTTNYDDNDLELTPIATKLKVVAFKAMSRELEGMEILDDIDGLMRMTLIAEVSKAISAIKFECEEADFDVYKSLDYGQVVTDMTESAQGGALMSESLSGVTDQKKEEILKSVAIEILENDMEELTLEFQEIQKGWTANGDGTYQASSEDIQALLIEHAREAYHYSYSDSLRIAELISAESTLRLAKASTLEEINSKKEDEKEEEEEKVN